MSLILLTLVKIALMVVFNVSLLYVYMILLYT